MGNMEFPWQQQWHVVTARDINAQYLRGTRSQIPVREGNYAVRVVVRPGDRAIGTSGERCEIGHYNDLNHGYTQEKPGDDFHDGFSMYIPTNWVTPAGWAIVAQWKHRSFSLPPIAINIGTNNMGIQFYTGLLKQMPSTWYSNYTNHSGYTFLNNPAKGVCTIFMVRIKFSPNNNGVVQIWHKLQWQTNFTSVFSKTNFPTMQLYTQSQWASLDTDNATTAPNNRIPWGNYVTTQQFCSIGLYRQNASFTNTLYFDNWARARWFSQILNNFQSGG